MGTGVTPAAPLLSWATWEEVSRREHPALTSGTFPLISGTLSRFGGAPLASGPQVGVSLEVSGPRPPWGLGLLSHSQLSCCASIAFMLRRVRPALPGFSGSRTLSTLVTGTRSGTSVGSRTSAVSPASGSGATPLPVQRTRRRTHLDVRGSTNAGAGLRLLRANFLHSPPSPTLAAALAWLQLEVGHPYPAKILLLRSSGASFHQPVGPTLSSLWVVCREYRANPHLLPWVGLGRESTASRCVCGRGWLLGEGGKPLLSLASMSFVAQGLPQPFSLTTALQTSGEAA